MVNSTSMTNNHIVQVNDHDFEQIILRADKPMVLKFEASWCPHCHTLAPAYARLAQKYVGNIGFAKMNLDDNMRVATDYNIVGMPTLLVISKGQEIGRLVGPPPSQLQDRLERIFAEHHIL